MPYLVVEMNDLLDASVNFNVTSRVLTLAKQTIKIAVVSLNVCMALYFGLVHQRGPNAAANFVFREILQSNPNTTVQILQLMPCFSMPQHSSLHPHPVHIRMLDCTAGLEVTRSQNQQLIDGQVEEHREEGGQVYDEADQFQDDPLGWIRDKYSSLVKPNAGGISVIIAYEKTYKLIQPFLEKKNYKVVKSIFHSHFLTSSKQDYRILISVKTQ